MREDRGPKAAGTAAPDYTLFLTGLRVAQATSPTAQAQSALAGALEDAAPHAPGAFPTIRDGREMDGSYRGFSKVTNGKRT